MKKNPLTDLPGGSTLRLEFKDGTTRYQQNIKYPKKYLNTVLEKSKDFLTKVVDETEKTVLYEQD